LVFSVDAGWLAAKTAAPIRYGRTGYAWIIDEEGNFLYHLEEKFIGQNAFEARQLEDPHISFTKINAIQKEKMLEGKEGTSWYISGWHRGEIGRMRKLIAYAPVHIGAANASKIWSVAVVAPMSEVQGAVQKVYLRQATIQVAFTVAVVIVLFFLRSYEMLWVRTLEREVETKTGALEKYAGRLKDSEERYRSLVESADDLICTLDGNCRVLSMNDFWSRLTGQPVEAVIGRHVADVMHFSDPERVRRLVEQVLCCNRSFSREERVGIGGREYWMDLKFNRASSAARSDGAAPPAVLVIARDLSERRRIESQLFNTQKLASLGELSAGVAHEINNPIAIILGFSEMLLEKAEEGSREQQVLQAVVRQGENCKRIVENLLAFARIPHQGTTQADPAGGLRKVVDIVKNTLLTEKIELVDEIPEALPAVNGDSRELEQVFLNIINNAAAAMSGGGVLRIGADVDGESVRIRFRDTGHGIAPENREKIFEPFFTTKKVGEGTGLGLSVSYGIVKKFGGEILVDSRTASEGNGPAGTTFTVVLPLAAEGRAEADAV
jgi:PAS domain S-box-containing protein